MSSDALFVPILSRLSMTRRDACDMTTAVTEHLQRLLNTRQNEALANPNYGLVDLVDLLAQLPNSAEQIGRSIEQCIRAFEPRLAVHAVTLTHDAPQHTLQFAIEASLLARPNQRQAGASLRLCAQIDETGRIEVRA